jgi:hypothetical protein
MTFLLFSRVILSLDIPQEQLMAGDIGTIVEHHPATAAYPEGYEVEFFAGNGETLTVVSVPATDLRQATGQEVMHVRPLVAA